MNMHRDFELAPPDLDAAAAFLAALDPAAATWTFQTFDDDGDRRDPSLARVLHGTLQEHAATLAALQERGAGVYVTINQTDGLGRKADNITRVRALFVDLDGAPLEPVRAWEEPHIIVGTSDGRWHAYWRVEDWNLEDFRPAQRRLIAAFDSDKNVHDLPRVMRLPGFWHLKDAPQVVRMLPSRAFPLDFPAETMRARLDALPSPEKPNADHAAGARFSFDTGGAGFDTGKATGETSLAEAAEILDFIDPDASYSDWLNALMGLHDLSGGSPAGLALAEQWSARGAKFRPGEVAAKWGGFHHGGGVRWATVAAMARDRGADLKEIARRHKDRPETARAPIHSGLAAGMREPQPPQDRADHRAPRGDATEPAASLTPTPFAPRDPTTIPPRLWLYGHHLVAGFVSLTVAPGGLGKTGNAAVETLAMATGRPLLGEPVPRPLRVWSWNGEDPGDEVERRFSAAMIHYDLTAADLGGRLHLDSGRNLPIKLVRQDRGGVVIARPMVDALVNAIRTAGIDVLVVDPFVTTHDVSENDNGAINTVVGLWREIAEKTGCAVELVHHAQKLARLQGDALGISQSRGASSLIDAARSTRFLVGMTEDEAARAGLPSHRGFFRIANGKANMAPPSDRATWRRLIGVPLGNGWGLYPAGDEVGVVEEWAWPDAFDGVSLDTLAEVRRRLRSGDWKASETAERWAGYAVAEALGLDAGPGRKADRNPAQHAARAKVRSMLKTWLRNSELSEVVRRDERTRRDTPFIVPVGSDDD